MKQDNEWDFSFYENGVYGKLEVPELELRLHSCNDQTALMARVGHLPPIAIAVEKVSWYTVPFAKEDGAVRTGALIRIPSDDPIFVAACNDCKIPEHLKLRLIYSVLEAQREIDTFLSQDVPKVINTIKRKWEDTSSWCPTYKMSAGLARPFSNSR